MKDEMMFPSTIEPERYELSEDPLYKFEVTRREFFKMLGSGLLVLTLVDPGEAAEYDVDRRFAAGRRNPPEIGAWLHISENGTVTVYCGKAEMGQNIRTSLSQAVAEELPVPFSSIQMVMGDTFLTPYDRGTFGSQTTPRTFPILHQAAAAAREMLIDLAAQKWNVARATLTMREGKIIRRGTDQSIDIGTLTQGQEIMKTISDDVSAKPAEKWKVAGTSVPKVDAQKFVTGEHRYTSDITIPGMLHGKILRPPAFNAKLRSVDFSAAKEMKDVTVVHEGDFIGIVAPDEYKASQAIKSIKAEWDTSPQISNKELFDHLKENTRRSRRGNGDTDGSLDEDYKEADQTLEHTYTVAYIAHTPLEPRAAVAVWDGDQVTAWTGTQRPFGVQSELSRAFQMPDEKVRVIMPDTGSGYGGKHTGEAAVEAARLAREVGRPVKLIWTREEEFTWAYFRPAGVIDVKGAIRKDGRISVWEFDNYNSGGSAIRPLYDIPNQRVEFHRSDSPLRQGSYRCLAATANHFARESFIDELAHAARMDALEFRLQNLKDERLKAVLTAAAEQFGWKDKQSTKTRGYGLAGGFEKDSYVANCAEIEIMDDDIKIIRVVVAYDCGAVVNPDQLKNQIEGMIMMGIGGALYEEIEFADGKIKNPRLSKYQVPRIKDAPNIEIVLLDRKDIRSAGAGETPIVAIAPAVANAVYNATGKRIRSMPMIPNGFKSA